MGIDPAIRALRGDPAAQRLAQRELESVAHDWRERTGVAEALADLETYGCGEALEQCSALARTMNAPAAARAFVEPLIAQMAQALEGRPLGHVPFRHQVSDGVLVLQLARAGRAIVSLVQYLPVRSAEAAPSVCFTDSERHELCLDGSAETRRVTVAAITDEGAELRFATEPLARGARASFAGLRESKIVDRVVSPLTMLRLSRSPQMPRPSTEYRLVDGALLHRAAGDCRDSRRELALALLGRMERRDAVPAMLDLTLGGSDSLRWQALRECLALDSAAGFGALCRIADAADDPLQRPACALRRDRQTRYPRLAAIEAEPCLA